MADNEAEVSTDTKIETTTETKETAPEVVKAGAPQRVSTFEKAPVEVGETQHVPEIEQPTVEDNPGDSLAEVVVDNVIPDAEIPALPELTDDQLKELWAKRFSGGFTTSGKIC